MDKELKYLQNIIEYTLNINLSDNSKFIYELKLLKFIKYPQIPAFCFLQNQHRATEHFFSFPALFF